MYAELMLKKCNYCGEEKELKMFASKRGKPSSRCKKCIGEYMKRLYLRNRDREIQKRREWYARDPEKACASVRRNYAKNKERISIDAACRRRGIVKDVFIKMLDEQKGVCANCKNINHSKKRLAIDHCHATGKVRGLLCDGCNAALGLLKEDPKRIQGLLEYIAKHQK